MNSPRHQQRRQHLRGHSRAEATNANALPLLQQSAVMWQYTAFGSMGSRASLMFASPILMRLPIGAGHQKGS
eukprot:4974609-Ditylum_brightwellii.AAC.1